MRIYGTSFVSATQVALSFLGDTSYLPENAKEEVSEPSLADLEAIAEEEERVANQSKSSSRKKLLSGRS